VNHSSDFANQAEFLQLQLRCTLIELLLSTCEPPLHPAVFLHSTKHINITKLQLFKLYQAKLSFLSQNRNAHCFQMYWQTQPKNNFYHNVRTLSQAHHASWDHIALCIYICTVPYGPRIHDQNVNLELKLNDYNWSLQLNGSVNKRGSKHVQIWALTVMVILVMWCWFHRH